MPTEANRREFALIDAAFAGDLAAAHALLDHLREQDEDALFSLLAVVHPVTIASRSRVPPLSACSSRGLAMSRRVVTAVLRPWPCRPHLTGALVAVGAPAPEPVKAKDGPLGMKFVALPKGTFYMGWDGEKGSAKKTEIKEDFEIAIHTVTQGQWQELMGKNPSWFSRDGEGKDEVKDIKDEDLKQFPVEMVSWDDAQEFIKKLNEKEKGKG